ncbi:MAG: hypothetical protein HQ559_01660 [Lentisphaerae bacterium]|nr:hypothetical protein [Lentisphaerota bacterium]
MSKIKYALDDSERVCRYREVPEFVSKGEWFDERAKRWVKIPVVETCWYTTGITLSDVSRHCKRNKLDYKQVTGTTAYEDTKSLRGQAK